MTIQNPNKLLRERAVIHRSLGTPSVPVVKLGNYFKLQFSFWVLLLAVATYLLTKTTYKETVAARGLLNPIQGTQEVVSDVSARVEQIHVVQGQRVESGDILATLSTETYNEQGSSAFKENIYQLQADEELLIRQLEVRQQALQQAKSWQELALENIHRNGQSLEKEMELLTTQTEISDRNLQAVSALLDTGNSSAREFDLQYQFHLELLGRSQLLSQRQLQNEHEIDSLKNAQQIAESDTEQASLQIQRELQAVKQRILNLNNQMLFTLIAQGPGIVAELALEQGKSVHPNQPLFFIHPSESELEATLYVPAAVQAKLRVGQSVLLRYDAFDYRLYGRKEATIVGIGQARLDPRETVIPIFGINEPVFKVTAELLDTAVRGDSFYRLQTGATLTVDFVLSDMSLLQFIFRPILGLQGKVT